MRAAHTSILVLFAACSSPAPTRAPTASPPSPTMAAVAPPAAASEIPPLRLPRTFVPSEYAARLAIDPARTDFTGVITITGEIGQRTPVVWLHGKDLAIRSAVAHRGETATPITVTPKGEDLLEVRGDLEAGTWRFTFEYAGKLDPLNTAGAFKQVVGGTPYVFTQLEALYARRVFPCLDEPDSKVPWQLTLDVPTSAIAVSNTPAVKESAVPGGKRFEFARTKPLPTYLVAFGVGPFDIVDAGKSKSGIPVRIVTMKGRGAEAAYAAQSTARILDLAEEWFAIPYPYEKLDMLVIPLTVGFSAMENAGLVTTTEARILFDPVRMSLQQKRGYVGITAHELAHQWFGNYVTMTWWDDLWLNEGFATWLGRKIVTRFEPAWREELGERDTTTNALDADSVVSARRVRQPIDRVDDIHNAFDGITYSKGAAVLNMFEAYVGADAFRRGVRDYLKARAFGNATSADFVAAVSAAAGRDLAPAFSTFLDRPGAPEIEARLACDAGSARVELAQQRFVPPGSPQPPAQSPWIVPVCFAYEKAGERAVACTLLDKQEGTLALDTKRCPRWLMPNANGTGYYRTSYTAPQAIALRDEGWSKLTWAERRSLFFDVAAAQRFRPRGMRNAQATSTPGGKLPLTLVLSLVPKLLGGGDRFTVGDALGVPMGLDRFVADDQRAIYEGWIRATFGPLAKQLGVMPRAGDRIDDEASRQDVLNLVGWVGRDPAIVARSRALAKNWRELPISIRRFVLRVAADADPDLHAKLIQDVKSEPNRARRGDMFTALASVRDAKRFEAALELTLDPEIDIRESGWMLVGSSSEETRKVAERFVRAHRDKLLARLPKDSVSGTIGLLASLFAGSCDETLRDEAKTYVTASFGKLAGGQRVLDQIFEGMDQCIAARKTIEPELRAFLAGVKLPKPARR